MADIEDEVVDEPIDEEPIDSEQNVDDEPEPEPDEKPEFSEDEIEAIGRVAEKIGWNRDYDGPNKKTPIEYIVEGRNIQEQLSKSLRDERRHFDSFKGEFQKVINFVQSQKEAKIAELESQIAEIEKEREEAVAEGDVERFKETEKRLEETSRTLESQKKDVSEVSKDEFNSVFDGWKSKNEWWESDEDMTLYAMAVRDKHQNTPEARAMSDEEWLGFIEEKVKGAFPHKFEKARPKPKASPVHGAGAVRRGASSPKKGLESRLSYQEKQVLEDFKRLVPGFDSEAYLKEILGEEA